MSDLTKLYKESLELENITRTLIKASGLITKINHPVKVAIEESFIIIIYNKNLGYCADCKEIRILEIESDCNIHTLYCNICQSNNIISKDELDQYKYSDERNIDLDIYVYIDELIELNPSLYTREYIEEIKYKLNEIYRYINRT